MIVDLYVNCLGQLFYIQVNGLYRYIDYIVLLVDYISIQVKYMATGWT